MPEDGYAYPGKEAETFESMLNTDRRIFLLTRGLLFLKLPCPAILEHGDFQWLLNPNRNDRDLTDAHWYCDGSAMTVVGLALK